MSQAHDDEVPRLTRLLRSIVPEPPDPSGRAGDVVRRSRHASQRRGAVGVVAAGAVVAAIAIIIASVTGSPRSSSAHPPITAPAHPFTCPAPGSPSRRPWTPSTDQVPPGAVLARLCTVHGPGEAPWLAPVDALTKDVGAVADSYNSLPMGQALPCAPPTQRSVGFTLTFQYSDGRLVQLAAQSDGTGGCDLVSIAGRADLGRAGAGLVVQAFSQLLQHQRLDQSPPAPSGRASLSCPPRPHFVTSISQPVRTLDFARVVLCDYGEVYPSIPLKGSAKADDSLVTAINADYAGHVTRDTSAPGLTCMDPDPRAISMYGETVWGDRIALSLSCSDWIRRLPINGRQVFWVTSDQVSSRIERALQHDEGSALAPSPGPR